ncbi:hypothetical protein A9G06_17045 [Aeromonas sp. DNP9]|nr:hypothetical protein A9G06_17045 [Aeromonas sp. DNP9]
MAFNIFACSSPVIREENPILDFEWETDIYNMMYSTVADVDNLRLWVRRTPNFADGGVHQMACVEIAQPGKDNGFYLVNLNTYGVQEINNCKGDYAAYSNFVTPNRYQSSNNKDLNKYQSSNNKDLNKKELASVDGVRATSLENGLYRFTFTNLFLVNQYELTAEGKATLRNVVDLARQWPVKHIRIYGVADSSGKYPHNQFLANARAQVVHDFLREEGVHHIPISLRGSVENGLPSAEERITQRRFIIEMKLDTQ